MSTQTFTGKMSVFGGPHDEGVSPTEGLALVEPIDLPNWWFGSLFLPYQPPGTVGLARRLNPDAFYLAMRWDYSVTPKAVLRNAVVKISAPNGLHVFARPVDWGPNINTGRIADLSPGVARVLNLQTDDEITVELLT